MKALCAPWCRYLGDSYASDKGPKDRIAPSQLPALAQRNFPLCMQNLFVKLREVRSRQPSQALPRLLKYVSECRSHLKSGSACLIAVRIFV